MTSITLSSETRDHLSVVKENLGYDRWDDFLSDLATFAEDNMDDFDAAFPPEEEDTEDEDGG
jgi:hypothetical protein